MILKALFFHGQLMIVRTKNENHSLLSTNAINLNENKFAIPIFKFGCYSNANAQQVTSHGRLANLSNFRRLSHASHNRRYSQRNSITTIQDLEPET